VPGAEFDAEFLFDLGNQWWGAQLIILLLAGIQPFPQRRMGLARMASSPIKQSLPPALSGGVFGLPTGQLAFIQMEAEGSICRFERLTGFDPEQQLLQALRLFQYSGWVVHWFLLT
jgi:hypothetical protein